MFLIKIESMLMPIKLLPMETKCQIKYQIIRSKCPDAMTIAITELLNSGWSLFGETFYIKESGLMCQALTWGDK